MNDPALDRRLENCRKLMQHWQMFHKYLNACMKDYDFKKQDEQKFLELKSQIAITHDSLVEAANTERRETAAIVSSIITIVERCILLSQMKKMNTPEQKRMEMEWHEAYLLINDVIGVLEEEVARLDEISEFHHNAEMAWTWVSTKVGRAATNRMAHFIIIVGILIGGGLILPAMGVFSYEFLEQNEYTRKAYWASRWALRGFAFDNLAYSKWESFEAWGPEGITERRQNVDGDLRNQIIDAFATVETAGRQGYEGVDSLDMTTELKSNPKMRKVHSYKHWDEEVYAGFFMYRTSGEAEQALMKYQMWRDALPNQGRAQREQSAFGYGRFANIFVMTYSGNSKKPELAQDLIDTWLGLKKD